MLALRPIVPALLCALLTSGCWWPTAVRAEDGTADITPGARGGLPGLFADGIALQWLVPGDAGATRTLREMDYEVRDEDVAGGLQRTLTSRQPVAGRYLTHRYVLSGGGSDAASTVLQLDLDWPGDAALEVSGQPGFIPEPLPGFGAIYTRVAPVVVDASGQQKPESPSGLSVAERLDAGVWFGVRNRYQTGILRTTAASVEIQFDTAQQNRPRIVARPTGSDSRLQLELYAGPIEAQSLAAADPELRGMLYAALWDWLRVLCFGMSWLLTKLLAVVGSAGAAVILLSVCVKILMSPLTMYADRLQDSVNRTAALLQPELDAIRREYKGEEAHKRTLAVYRKHGVSTMYPARSLVGFLIQIPIFFAAFDMLGESTLLDGTAFLWMDDLATPDRALLLPFEMPFFGAHLNLLPFLMTGVTLLTSWLQTDPSLTPELLRRQRIRLYLLAIAFFVLFYTFPAGMVLYWTTNNVLHLLKIQARRLWEGAR